MKKIRGIIFDMDGTLVDSMWGWENYARLAADYYDLPHKEQFYEATYHRSVADVIAVVKELYGIEVDSTNFWDWLLPAMDAYYETVQLKPNTLSTLIRLQADGYKICVATATRGDAAKKVLDRLGVTPYLKFILSCMDLGAGKERPDVFLEAARRLELPIDEILVIEDHILPVKTALAAGFTVAGIHDDHEAKREEIRSIADYWFDDLSEVYPKVLSEN